MGLALTCRPASWVGELVSCRYGFGVAPYPLEVQLALLGCEEWVELLVLDSVEDQLPLYIFSPSQPLIRVHIELLRNGLQCHWQVVRLILVETGLGPVVQRVMHQPRRAVARDDPIPGSLLDARSLLDCSKCVLLRDTILPYG